MPPRRRAKAKAMPRSDAEGVRDVPLDEARERHEFGQRPEGEQSRIYHIAGRLNAMYSHDDPAFFSVKDFLFSETKSSKFICFTS